MGGRRAERGEGGRGTGDGGGEQSAGSDYRGGQPEVKVGDNRELVLQSTDKRLKRSWIGRGGEGEGREKGGKGERKGKGGGGDRDR